MTGSNGFALQIELEPTAESDPSEAAAFVRQLERQLASADFEPERLPASAPPPGAKAGFPISQTIMVAVVGGTAEYLVGLCYDFIRSRANLAKLKVTGPGGQKVVFPKDSIEAGYTIASRWKTYPLLQQTDSVKGPR